MLVQYKGGSENIYNPNTADKIKEIMVINRYSQRIRKVVLLQNKEIMSQKYKNTIFLTTGCIFVSTAYITVSTTRFFKLNCCKSKKYGG